MAGEVLALGAYRRVRFAIEPGGRLAARADWDALPDTSRARLQAYFEYFADTNQIQNPKQYSKIEGTNLRQWRHSDYRVLCCDRGRDHVICVVVAKLNKKLQRPIFVKASRICTEDIGGD